MVIEKEIWKRNLNVISPPPFLGTLPKSISCALNHSDSRFVCGPVHF